MGDGFWYMVSGIAASVTLLGMIGGFTWKHVKPAVRDVRQTLEHVIGVPANAITGQKAVPGLFPRVTAIEDTLVTLTAAVENLNTRVASIDHEVKPNSGQSMHDMANRADKSSAAALEAVQKLMEKLLPPEEGKDDNGDTDIRS